MNKETIRTRLSEYIVESFLYDEPDFKLADDFPLFEERVIDSMGIFRLVSYMHEEFDVVVQPDDMVIDNFGTLASMTQLVSMRLQSGAETSDKLMPSM